MERSISSIPLVGACAIVTGASRGIGFAIAEELLLHGAKVGLVARDPQRLAAAIDSLLTRFPGQVVGAAADLRCPDDTRHAFNAVLADLGSISILVNNAGSSESTPFEGSTPDHWQKMIDSNLITAVNCTREVLPRMRANRYGRIINVSSTAGLKGYRYVSGYCAAKHALIGFTRSLALEVASHGITVNAVCPGFADTDMLHASIETIAERTARSRDDIRSQLSGLNPQGRFITPREVASAVTWLAEGDQSGINGHSITIAGGEI